MVSQARTLLQTLVVLLSVAGVTIGINHVTSSATAYPPISCSDGRIACSMDSHCHVMLTAIPRICNTSGAKCTPKGRLQCRAVQKWLQLTPLFQSCHCQVPAEERAACLQLRRLVYTEYCSHTTPAPTHMSRDRPVPTLPSNSLSPYVRSRMRQTVSGRIVKNMDEEEDKISCIGMRKRCLLDRTCRGTLTDFRRLCRENKKKEECVTTDRDGCFKMIERLRESGIFDCHCNHVKKYQTRRKCDRIQYRLANNTCLVAVPYLVHSSKAMATSYEDLLDIVSSVSTPAPGQIRYLTWNDAAHTSSGSTCVAAFAQCNADPSCRLRMAEFMNMCTWNARTNTCNRGHCLAAIRKFYLVVRPEMTYALLFCQCELGDYKCEAIRQGLYPTCSTVETPPPSCLSIIDRCELDADCSERWHSYENYCSYDKISGGCSQGPKRCRNALVRIMGTVLTTNCTCALPDEAANQNCYQARRRLQHNNVCKAAVDVSCEDAQRMQRGYSGHLTDDNGHRTFVAQMAFEDYNKNHVIPTPRTVHYWQDTISKIPMRRDCLRNLGHKIPSYMSMPAAVRMYHNDSECSDLCQCMSNGTLRCKRLPCSPSLSCREKSMVYAHGSGFVRADRGQCRCIKAEVVCARPESMRRKQRTGLFLHVGYSIADRYLIEGNSDVKFDPVKTATKLGTLLNGDTAEQFCRLSLYYQEDGNLLFEIKLSKHTSDTSIAELCESPTKTLSYMINARHSTIVTDAELSILKVAEMEMVQRLTRPMRSNTANISIRLSPATCLPHPMHLIAFLATVVLVSDLW